MREIKFRAKRIDNGAWVFGHYFKTPLTDENSGTDSKAGWFFLTGEPRHCISSDGSVFVVDDLTLGEFTGLLDKNRKEIWEGDIIRLSSYGKNDSRKIQVVAWNEDKCGYIIQERGPVGRNQNYSEANCDSLYECEIIGNIYEHSHLLKD